MRIPTTNRVGRRDDGQVRSRRRRRHRRHLHRRRARFDPEPSNGPTRHLGQHRRHSATGDGSSSGNPGGATGLARLCGLRTTGGENPPPLPEGSFARTDLSEAVAPLVKVIRSFQPHVMTTYNESDGGYRHPDHVMCHKISVAAFERAADPDAYPELGAVWQPLKLYYSFTFHRERTVALDRAMVARGLESPYTERLRKWPEDPKHAARITTRIDCAEYFSVRDRALLAHSTQVDPDGPWFAVPLEVHKSAWPTEEWELARSLVETSVPEDDLFAGIAESAGE